MTSYDAIIIGGGHNGLASAAYLAKAGLKPLRELREFRVGDDEEFEAGQALSPAEVLAPGDRVDVVGISKGKGFQGVMKRHNFAGGRSSHGSMFHRAPGSIGSSAYPSRVFAGMRGTGRMGGERVTVKNLKVVKVDEENNLLYLRGAVPGAKDNFLTLRRAKRG